jgi:hypothetical protein
VASLGGELEQLGIGTREIAGLGRTVVELPVDRPPDWTLTRGGSSTSSSTRTPAPRCTPLVPLASQHARREGRTSA